MTRARPNAAAFPASLLLRCAPCALGRRRGSRRLWLLLLRLLGFAISLWHGCCSFIRPQCSTCWGDHERPPKVSSADRGISPEIARRDLYGLRVKGDHNAAREPHTKSGRSHFPYHSAVKAL